MSLQICIRSLLCFALATFFLSLEVTAETNPNADSRPNFVLIIADDMAAEDCGAMGHPHIRTPNLDQLAASGLTFDRAFLTCSSCSPSRCSIITSKYPHQTDAEQLHWPLPENQITFVELLRKAGYYTAQSGKWHLGPSPKRGFDAVQAKHNSNFADGQFPADSPINSDNNNASGCAGWAETVRQVPADKPFFLWLAAVDPHRDYHPNILKQSHTPNDVIVPPFIPDTPEVRADFAMYYDEITRLDAYVGQVQMELQKSGRDQNTYIIFISDNGRPFPRCKTTVFDSGIQTPFIVRVPSSSQLSNGIAGKHTDAMVSSIDIGATILDLANVASDPTMMGKSFQSVLANPGSDHREFVFSEHNWHDYDAHQRAVRSEKFKYIRNFDYDLTLSPPADAVRSATFREMQRMRDDGTLSVQQMQCFEVPRTPEELYDLEADPYELNNLAGNAEYKEVLTQMRSELDAWRLETYDGATTQRSPDEFDRESGKGIKNIPLRVGKNEGFAPMFNGTDLSGWKRINTHPSTWKFEDGVLKCTGKPIGELRTERMYQNFIMELEWRHLVPKGNAGIFVWADDITARGVPFHRGIEVQVLENDYGNTRSHTTHGDIFPIHGATMTPINGRGGSRAFPTESLSNPAPEWNHYRIVCNDGEIALAVNGKIVTRGTACSPKKGYICIESEGGVVEYRNVRIKELPNTPIAETDIANADRDIQCLYLGIDLEGWNAQPQAAWKSQDWVLTHRAENTESRSTLAHPLEANTSHIILDVKLLTADSQFAVKLGNLTVSSQDAAIKEALPKPGTWARIEVVRSAQQSTVTINGTTAMTVMSTEPDELVIEATGNVDFANIYSGP